MKENFRNNINFLILTIFLAAGVLCGSCPTYAIPVGTNPQGVAVNEATNKIYVANYNSNSVSIIDGVTNTVETTIGVGNFQEIEECFSICNVEERLKKEGFSKEKIREIFKMLNKKIPIPEDEFLEEVRHRKELARKKY